MRNKSLLLSTFALLFVALTATACPGGGDDDDDGTGGTPDASVNLPDANIPNTPDAAPMPSAASLGQVCNMMTACPTGYVCSLVEMGATNGLCTLPCAPGTMGGQEGGCGASNGFPGPGQGYCGLTIMMVPHCAIACGAQQMLPDMCPMGLTCKDLIMGAGNDLCAP